MLEKKKFKSAKTDVKNSPVFSPAKEFNKKKKNIEKNTIENSTLKNQSDLVKNDSEINADEKSVLSKNTDIPVFDEYLVKKGIVWRWYRRNGMPYEEEYNEYEREVKNRFASGLATKDINLAAGFYDGRLEGVVINAAKSN